MTAPFSPLDLRLLDCWQRGFPLTPRPFAALGEALGLGEAEVIDRIAGLRRRDLVSRVGAVVRPNTVGVSTLAAMAVPRRLLEQVAERVSAEPSVNHNYEREHRLNLWFVVTAADRAAVAETLAAVARDTGIKVLDLPLKRAYHIDLGFRLRDGEDVERPIAAPAVRIEPDAHDRLLLAAIEDGLPLVARPFAVLAGSLGCAERDVIGRLKRLIDGGVVSRFGLVVKHRALGYRANAMAVWDVPDGAVDTVAATFAHHSFVTLCYRRPRRLPLWPYNLFCMIHGRDRTTVRDQISVLNVATGTDTLAQTVLFSRRCFKQRGARFSLACEEAVA